MDAANTFSDHLAYGARSSGRTRVKNEPLFDFDDMLRWQRGDLPPEWFHTQSRISIERAKMQHAEWVELVAWAQANDPDLYAKLTTMTF